MLALVVVVGGGTLLLRQPGPTTRPPAGPPGPTGRSGGDPRGIAATALLDRLATRLRTGSPRQVMALAPPGERRARRELDILRSNVRSLKIGGLSFRYLPGTSRPPTRGETRAHGDLTWVGEVRMAWRLRGVDQGTSHTRLPMGFRDVGSGSGAGVQDTRFVTARADPGGPVPLWILGRVAVARTTRSLVVSADPGSTVRFSRLADQAVLDVRTVLRGWTGRLVVEVPRHQRELTRVLGTPPGAYSAIAAVTTTADGTLSRRAPTHVFVNPDVLDPLGPRGSQIVTSHEATHVAMDAALSQVPDWVLEGFADYVALAHVDLPVSRTASQILTQVRRSGTPAHLPGRSDFDPGDARLGATYESAWLACRLIAERYGERRLVEFYRAAERAGSTRVPFRTVLGTDVRTFTRAWRDDLRRLAR